MDTVPDFLGYFFTVTKLVRIVSQLSHSLLYARKQQQESRLYSIAGHKKRKKKS